MQHKEVYVVQWGTALKGLGHHVTSTVDSIANGSTTPFMLSSVIGVIVIPSFVWDPATDKLSEHCLFNYDVCAANELRRTTD